MPHAARLFDLTSHGTPLIPGPGCPTVFIGFQPAWRALPSAMASAVEGISNAMNSFVTRPQMTPADATVSLVQISQGLVQAGAAAAANGAPAAAATAGSMVAALNAANVALTATWAAASVVPGGQPAANIAYTEGIKAAAAAAASAVMASMAGLSDMHTCPIPAPTTHGPGFVTRGSSTVNIGNLPAARQNDRVFEACGGADPIAMGCPTVNIGDGGIPGAFGLARGASTPATAVGLDADGSVYFGPYIVIVGSAEFQASTVANLTALAGTPSGKAMFGDILSSGHTITIREGSNIGQNTVSPSNGMINNPDTWNGTGTDVSVTYYPQSSNLYGSGADWDYYTPEVGLGHELIHGIHIANGDVAGDPTQGRELTDGTDRDIANEEARTIGMEKDPTNGLPDYTGEPYSENTIRVELGFPPRKTYDDPATGTW